jgi:hypothetical protein
MLAIWAGLVADTVTGKYTQRRRCNHSGADNTQLETSWHLAAVLAAALCSCDLVL